MSWVWPLRVLGWSVRLIAALLTKRFEGRRGEPWVCPFHGEEESIASCFAADQLSSFRVACVADHISSRNKLYSFQLLRDPPCHSCATCKSVLVWTLKVLGL